jgi:DNA-directed RNA polymerase subunit E"
MSKKKACKKCKLFVDGNQCPLCKTEVFSNVWQGRLLIIDPKKSIIAQNMEIESKGEYAIKVR